MATVCMFMHTLHSLIVVILLSASIRHTKTLFFAKVLEVWEHYLVFSPLTGI